MKDPSNSPETPLVISPINKADDTNNTNISQTPSDLISQSSDLLKNINTIKDELCKLPLNPCESEYITSYIFPIVNTLYLLATSSSNLSNSVNILTNSPIVKPKRSKLKSVLHTIYDMNDTCEDLYEIVKERIKDLP